MITPDEIVRAAKTAYDATHIPESIQIAQWRLESGNGIHEPGNNPFGIKAIAGYTSQMLPTHEYVHHHMVSVTAPFAVFPDIATAFMVHAKLLANAPCYAHARAALPDVYAFANALTGVYATDPNYGAALGTIIRGSNLTQYDG